MKNKMESIRDNHMGNYLLFYYEGYYPRGAFNDFIKSFDSKEEVYNYIDKLPSSLKEKLSYSFEFQILNKQNMQYINLSDIDLIKTILDESKYLPLKSNVYFDDLVEDCEEEDSYD